MADAYREARKAVTQLVGSALRDRSYGPGLHELSLICIILQDADQFPEVRRYDKRNRVFDMRLRIPHDAFAAADTRYQQQMVMYTLLRSIKEMRTLAVPGIDHERLENDVSEVARLNGLT